MWKIGANNLPQRSYGNEMAYSINLVTNETSSAVFLEFEYLSDEFKIVKICRFQCIGWILDAVSQVEVEVLNGAIWMNPEASVNALIKFPKIPEALAKNIISSNSKYERFNLAWNYITDEEKNSAITVNFDYYHNFWPNFQIYAKAFALHLVNTQHIDDLRGKAIQLKNELQQSSINKKEKADAQLENDAPNILNS